MAEELRGDIGRLYNAFFADAGEDPLSLDDLDDRAEQAESEGIGEVVADWATAADSAVSAIMDDDTEDFVESHYELLFDRSGDEIDEHGLSYWVEEVEEGEVAREELAPAMLSGARFYEAPEDVDDAEAAELNDLNEQGQENFTASYRVAETTLEDDYEHLPLPFSEDEYAAARPSAREEVDELLGNIPEDEAADLDAADREELEDLIDIAFARILEGEPIPQDVIDDSPLAASMIDAFAALAEGDFQVYPAEAITDEDEFDNFVDLVAESAEVHLDEIAEPDADYEQFAIGLITGGDQETSPFVDEDIPMDFPIKEPEDLSDFEPGGPLEQFDDAEDYADAVLDALNDFGEDYIDLIDQELDFVGLSPIFEGLEPETA